MSTKQLLQFLNASPSPFHAVDSAVQLLAGWTPLSESQVWNLEKGKNYYFKRNQSALIAFSVGGKYEPGNGFSILGAHTDSPCLRVKPRSKRDKVGYAQVGVETYGGGLWNTWFDRDLSIAGRVLVYSLDRKEISHRLVDLRKPILRIPTLAIHLDRSVSDGFKFNNETQLTPILGLSAEKEWVLDRDWVLITSINRLNGDSAQHHAVLLKMIAEKLDIQGASFFSQIAVEQIGDFELCLYDTQEATTGGANDEFIFSARLDNLNMSFCAIKGLIESLDTLQEEKTIRIVGLFDDEEVGSLTAHGANSNLLESTIKRLAGISFGKSLPRDVFEISLTNSFFISADMAHAIHPNYAEKHEENHRPLMNKGVVIKENANQRYATTAISTCLLREVAKLANIALQEFVVRNDSPCGSTIGPMLSAKLGLRTIGIFSSLNPIDIGNPQLSMHSIREQAGVRDTDDAIQLFKSFFSNYYGINARLNVNQ